MVNNHENQDLVTIVIATFNMGAVLKNAIDSVLNQTYKNVECLIRLWCI